MAETVLDTDKAGDDWGAAMAEQQAAISEINASLNELTRIGQSNATAAEEITATMLDLSKLAEHSRGEFDKFKEIWTAAFAPLRGWVSDVARCVAAEVQRDFRNFRVARGLVTYADQVALADELLQHPDAARERLDHLVAVIFDQIRLEDDALVLERDLGAEVLELFLDDVGQVVAVALGFGDVHGRLHG